MINSSGYHDDQLYWRLKIIRKAPSWFDRKCSHILVCTAKGDPRGEFIVRLEYDPERHPRDFIEALQENVMVHIIGRGKIDRFCSGRTVVLADVVGIFQNGDIRLLSFYERENVQDADMEDVTTSIMNNSKPFARLADYVHIEHLPSNSQLDFPDDDLEMGKPSESVIRMWQRPRDQGVYWVRVLMNSNVRYNIRAPISDDDSGFEQQFRGTIIGGALSGLDVYVTKAYDDRRFPEKAGSIRCVTGQLRGYCERVIQGCVFYHLEVLDECDVPVMCFGDSNIVGTIPVDLALMWNEPFNPHPFDCLEVRLISNAAVTYVGKGRNPYTDPFVAIMFRCRIISGEYYGLDIVVVRVLEEPTINATQGVSMVYGRECKVAGIMTSIHHGSSTAPAYFRLDAARIWRTKGSERNAWQRGMLVGDAKEIVEFPKEDFDF
ncbi:hypothetical protein BGX34_009633 [Mortierella sp. NVP85]|nr:hypothetical protein BGX34_009633 [Mortierella sp. NVP85]